MEWVNFTPRPSYSRGKQRPVSVTWAPAWAPVPVCMFWRRRERALKYYNCVPAERKDEVTKKKKKKKV